MGGWRCKHLGFSIFYEVVLWILGTRTLSLPLSVCIRAWIATSRALLKQERHFQNFETSGEDRLSGKAYNVFIIHLILFYLSLLIISFSFPSFLGSPGSIRQSADRLQNKIYESLFFSNRSNRHTLTVKRTRVLDFASLSRYGHQATETLMSFVLDYMRKCYATLCLQKFI